MRYSQFIECFPVHPFWFPAIAVEKARFPPQLFPDTISPPCHAVVISFPLAWVGQLVTEPTSEDAATVEDRHTATAATGRAEKPVLLTAKVAAAR